MSQTTESAKMTTDEFEEMENEARKRRVESGLRHGPCYSEGESAPLVWYDQVFEREITPQGSVTCKKGLRVGATQNSLDIILVGSHKNSGKLSAAANATVTVTLLQADEEDGEYAEVGPTICVKAPAEGIAAEPDHLFARFPIGNFSKPWLKVKLDFAGSISGGKCDCALSLVAR